MKVDQAQAPSSKGRGVTETTPGAPVAAAPASGSPAAKPLNAARVETGLVRLVAGAKVDGGNHSNGTNVEGSTHKKAAVRENKIKQSPAVSWLDVAKAKAKAKN